MSLRWWWASRMTGRCTRWERWLPGSGTGGRLNVLNWNLDSAFRANSSFELNILGPLCLWQCLLFDFRWKGMSKLKRKLLCLSI